MLYIIILLLGAVAASVGPWWSVAAVAFVTCALKAKSSKQAFGVSAAAGISLWVIYSLILIYSGKENLVDRIATLFVGNISSLSNAPKLGVILTVITLIASLTVGFSGLAGRHIRKLFT